VTVQLQSIAADFDVILMTGPAASPAITGENLTQPPLRVSRNPPPDFPSSANPALDNPGGDFIHLAADYEFGRATAGAAEAVLGSAGINFVQDTIYAPTDTTDFTPYFQQLLDSGADAVVITWAGDSTVTLMQQLEELGVPDQMAVIVPFNSNEIVSAVPPPAGSEAWMIYHYSFPDNPINDWLVEQHRAAFDDVPDLFTECSFATAQALVQALNATEGDTLPEAMIPALEGLEFEGPKGSYLIRPEDHQALVPMYIARLTNTDDPDFLYYELLETIPAEDIVPPCNAGEERCGPAE
jgi:branched-chain amino acid transport system substrate-binding protein